MRRLERVLIYRCPPHSNIGNNNLSSLVWRVEEERMTRDKGAVAPRQTWLATAARMFMVEDRRQPLATTLAHDQTRE